MPVVFWVKIFVTGASGFVGSTLTDSLLDQGHEVSLLLRRSSSRVNLGREGYTVVEGDLRDPASLAKAVRDVEAIIHVAGVISAPKSADYFLANFAGTANLAEAAVRYAKNLQRFVYVSSLAAGGPTQYQVPRVESDAPAPISVYGTSKLQGEIALQRWGKELPSVVVRPPIVYGPRDRGMYTFFKIVNLGLLPSIRHNAAGMSSYSLVHVEDLVQALICLATSKRDWVPAEVFYVSGEGEYSWDEIMAILAQALQKRGLKVPVPVPALKFVANILGGIGRLSGKNVPLNRDKAKEIAAPYWTCSNAKIKRDLQFKPYWALEHGFRQTADWYRSRAWL